MKNCGSGTMAKIVTLQKEYGKELSIVKEQQETIESHRAYISRLIVVAMAANEVVKGAKKGDRYYLRVTKQRFNALRLALEMFRKQ